MPASLACMLPGMPVGLDLVHARCPEPHQRHQRAQQDRRRTHAGPLHAPNPKPRPLTAILRYCCSATSAGTATYTGRRGTVSAQTPLVVTANTHATMLGTPFGRARLQSNGDRYDVLDPSMAQTFYLMAFLDLNDNGTRDPIEPFEIYQDKAGPPGDPVMIAPDQTGIDFVFGDENLPPTPTPRPAFCVGDCTATAWSLSTSCSRWSTSRSATRQSARAPRAMRTMTTRSPSTRSLSPWTTL